MRIGPGLVIALAAASLLPGLAQAADHTADTALYLHRDGTMNATAPKAGDDAVLTFGPLPPHSARWTTPPLVRNWSLRGPATFHFTIATQYAVLSRLNATLDAGERVVANSTMVELVIDARQQDVDLTFSDLPARIAAGQPVGLTLTINPVAYADLLGVPQVNLVDLKVDILYDSALHAGGLRVLGMDGGATNGPGSPGDPGSDGAPGTPSAPGSGGNGNGGGTTGSGSNGEAISLLNTGGVPPETVLMGLGTSSIVMVTALALRGRFGLG